MWLILVKSRRALFAIVVITGSACAAQQLRAGSDGRSKNQIVVGAIRWDAWHGDRSDVSKAVERSLSPPQWHYRLPFFARIVNDDDAYIDDASQAVMDEEIDYAETARLNYWAFLLYDEDSPMTLGLKYYLSSRRKAGLRFCVIVELAQWKTPELAAKQSERVADLMTRPEYQMVEIRRPLLYVLDNGMDADAAPDEPWARKRPAAALAQLRALVRRKGAGDPYVVIQDWRPRRANELRMKLHGDAISSYSYQRDGKNAPFSQLAEETERFWDECRAMDSAVVPVVMTGWDRRPRVEQPVFWESWQKPDIGIDKFYRAPSPAELSHHLADALAWIRAHPGAAPARVVLIYAWNENDEGGWLVPTFGEGRRRLQAVRNVLQTDH